MAFWDWFIGTPKVVEKVTDTAAGVVNSGMTMLDKAFYTDQEKNENGLKLVGLFLELQKLLANDSGISAIARRAVAFLIMATFCFLVVGAAAVYKIDAQWSAFILKMIEDSNLGYLAILVGVFFFGFYAFGKYTKWGTTSVMPEEKKEEQK